MQVFLSDCPKGNLSFSQNFDAFEQLVTRQRLLKFDASPPIGKHVGLFVKYDSKLHQSWYRVIPLHIEQTHIITYDAGAKRVCSSCTSQIFPLIFSIKSKVAEADDIHSNEYTIQYIMWEECYFFMKTKPLKFLLSLLKE